MGNCSTATVWHVVTSDYTESNKRSMVRKLLVSDSGKEVKIVSYPKTTADLNISNTTSHTSRFPMWSHDWCNIHLHQRLTLCCLEVPQVINYTPLPHTHTRTIRPVTLTLRHTQTHTGRSIFFCYLSLVYINSKTYRGWYFSGSGWMQAINKQVGLGVGC